jgi:2-keto-4-pentenoate hydratase
MNALAAQLLAAFDAGDIVDLPSATAPLTMAEGYAVGLMHRELRMARGESPRGYKIGFTNRSLWERYGVDGPVCGTVWSSSVSYAGTGESRVSLAKLSQPRIEPEVIFGLSRDVPLDASAEELAACIAWAAHGFEIVQCNYANWKFTASDCLADFAMHGRLIVGRQVPVNGNLQAARALASTRIHLVCDGEVRDSGVATNVLDGPFEALLEVNATLRKTSGAAPMRAGDVITTGTLTDAHPVAPGETWSTHVSHSPLAPLSVRFVA